MRSSGAGKVEPAAWLEEVTRINHAGDIYVRLRRGESSLLLQLSPVGAHPKVLARGELADVSYNEIVGLSEAAAVRLARAYGDRLDEGRSLVPVRFPHLAIAAAAGRAPGSCRPVLTKLWPRELNLPVPVGELRLNTAGVKDFLLPEIGVDAAPFAGFILRAIEPGTRASCVLEFEPEPGSASSGRVLIVVGEPDPEDTGFGACQTVRLAVRHGAPHSDLPADVARLCSFLAALVELKQSPEFSMRVPEARATVASASSEPSAVSQSFAADTHRFAVLSSGFTVLRQVLPPSEVGALAAAADRALAAMQAAAAAGREIAYTFYDKDTYLGTRCIYCWGEAPVRLIENDVVRCVADAVIGPHKLFDMSAHRALPAAHLGAERTEEWHRDIDVFDDSPQSVRYLWFFVPLDEFTAENGATWIVPGSQRLPNSAVPRQEANRERFPTRVQLTGSVGDVFVVNPSALHTVGHNATDKARTMLNLGVCHTSITTLLDNWAIAGPAIQTHASERLRRMLGADDAPPPDPTWSVLPEGWRTSPRGAAFDPSTRVFPPEQQGYQRSHRLRDQD